jgi:tripartite-type tricarboxylate transporter receptor subunit TctC
VTRRRDILLVLAGSVLLPALSPAADRPYPDRTVRIVVTYPPGGQADAVGRLVAAKLGEVLGGSVIVDNRPGGNAMIGVEVVANGPPDGYALLLGGAANLTIAPAYYGSPHYDTLQDFVAIGRVARVPQLLAVHASLPITTVPQLVAYAKRNPGKLTFASTAPANELALASLRAAEGVDILSISYKGTAQAMTDLIAGRLDLIVADAASVAPHVHSGTLRVIANAGAERAREFENVPTLTEQGLSIYVWDSWQGLVAPRATPADIVERLQQAVKQVVTSKDYRDALERLGFLPIDEPPERFSTVLQEETARHKALVTQLRKDPR